MKPDWSLRDEIYAAAHRWPEIILFCLVGGLLGWLVSFVWPSPYQATSELYVGLEIYRALDDPNVVVQFNYPDDYKNWQMANLEAITQMPPVMEETLERLRRVDPYWEGVAADDLPAWLDVYWRNAGRWRLVATHPQRRYAVQAVEVWRDVAMERVQEAIDQGRQTFVIDTELDALAAQQAALQSRAAVLDEALNSLEDWQADNLPADAGREQVIAILLDSFETTDSLLAAQLLSELPARDAPAETFLDWVERSQVFLEQERDSQLAQEKALGVEQDELLEQYAAASEESLGVSANLTIERMEASEAQVDRLRPTAIIALVGGMLGLLAWIAVWFARLGRKAAA